MNYGQSKGNWLTLIINIKTNLIYPQKFYSFTSLDAKF